MKIGQCFFNGSSQNVAGIRDFCVAGKTGAC